MSVSVDSWVLHEERPGKRIYSGFDRHTGELILMEEFYDDLALDAAAAARDQAQKHKDMRHLAVVPDSVRARALREGWYFDEKAWKRWMNDSDNSRLRVSGGTA